MKNSKITGQKIWRRAKKIIPGGTMLFSKNPDLYLPNYWPAYFSKAKDCFIWDLDNRKYIDMCMMGVGTNVLGYSNREINKEILKGVKKGNISTLNAPEEIKLAEQLLHIHPWAKQVKFARSGGEASAVALRIARAASKKDNVAICGYHGWHDWYLSSNLNNKNNLNNYLFKDLQISGVHSKLAKSTFPFKYNNIDNLVSVVKKNNIGTIFMEVERDEKPKISYLKQVRDFATKNKIILIFDECTSGFRETLGGMHLKYKINPDIAIFGKAIGNGYPLNPIIGTKKIMEKANTSFISSTFWTERLGYIAAISTINIIKRKKTWNTINQTGLLIKKKWREISNKNNIDISIYGLNSIPKFKFNYRDNLLHKTYLTQEFLKAGILANTTIYVSISHSQKILNKYFIHLDKIFKKIRKIEMKNENLKKYIKGKICISGMRETRKL